MTEPVSSSGMTIDIRPMIEDVSQVMTKHITGILSGVIGEYTVYKETHDTIMGLQCVSKLQHRIAELELRDTTTTTTAEVYSGSSCSNNGPTREELQAAIVDLNRYIHALETKVNTVAQASSFAATTNENENENEEEETVRLEIHEDENDGHA